MPLHKFIIEISYHRINKYQDMPDWWEVCLCITFISVYFGLFRTSVITSVTISKTVECYLSNYTEWVQDSDWFWSVTLTFDPRQQWKPKLASFHTHIKNLENGKFRWLKAVTEISKIWGRNRTSHYPSGERNLNTFRNTHSWLSTPSPSAKKQMLCNFLFSTETVASAPCLTRPLSPALHWWSLAGKKCSGASLLLPQTWVNSKIYDTVK